MKEIAFCLFCCAICIAMFMGITLFIVVAVNLYREYKKFKSIDKDIEKLQREIEELIDKIH